MAIWKNISIFSLCMFLIQTVPMVNSVGTFCSIAGAAEEHFPFQGEVARGPVNVRAGANANFEVVDKLTQGETVVVLGRSYEWYKVQLPPTATAYVRADYITFQGQIGQVTGNKVNVRAKPNSSASVLGQVTQGDVVRLLQKTDDWWQIEPPAKTIGWVHGDFVRFKSAAIPVSPEPKTITKDVPVISPKPILMPISVQGRLEPLAAADNQACYQILANGLPAYTVADAPGIDRFNHAVVRIEAMVGPDQKLLTNIQKITLVL
jgi:SH3-like domain-containing protein